MREQIITIMSQVFECEILSNATQENTEKWDSLSHLNLMIELEMAFDVDFEPEEIAEMKSVEMIEQMINNKKL